MNSFKFKIKSWLAYVNKKYLVIGGVLLVVVLGVLLYLLFFGGSGVNDGKDGTNDDNGNVSDDTEWKDTGRFNYDVSNGGNGNSGGKENSVSNPMTWYGGVTGDYVSESSYGVLTVFIGGDTNKRKVVHIEPGCAVFDANQNIIVLPSKIPKGATAGVLVEGGMHVGEEKAVAVILNADPQISYGVIKELKKDDKNIEVQSSSGNIKYVIKQNTPVFNALTGDVYEKSKLKERDRIFVYEGNRITDGKDTGEGDKDKRNSNGVVSEGTGFDDIAYVVEAKKVYVYPAPSQ